MRSEIFLDRELKRVKEAGLIKGPDVNFERIQKGIGRLTGAVRKRVEKVFERVARGLGSLSPAKAAGVAALVATLGGAAGCTFDVIGLGDLKFKDAQADGADAGGKDSDVSGDAIGSDVKIETIKVDIKDVLDDIEELYVPDGDTKDDVNDVESDDDGGQPPDADALADVDAGEDLDAQGEIPGEILLELPDLHDTDASIQPDEVSTDALDGEAEATDLVDLTDGQIIPLDLQIPDIPEDETGDGDALMDTTPDDEIFDELSETGEVPDVVVPECLVEDDCPDDAVLCTVKDCINNTCVQVSANLLCKSSQCTLGACAPNDPGADEFGCIGINMPNTTDCDDDDKCTEKDKCKDGACKGTPVETGDGKGCTIDLCDKKEGVKHDLNDEFCNYKDFECTYGVCDPSDPTADSDGCINEFLPDLMPCDDGDACSLKDSCDAGVCVGTDWKTCDDGVACTKDSCDLATGGCVNVADDTKCPLPADQCQQSKCDVESGCTPKNLQEGTSCDLDGSKCTPDTCVQSKCTQGQKKVCQNDEYLAEECWSENGQCVTTIKSKSFTLVVRGPGGGIPEGSYSVQLWYNGVSTITTYNFEMSEHTCPQEVGSCIISVKKLQPTNYFLQLWTKDGQQVYSTYWQVCTHDLGDGGVSPEVIADEMGDTVPSATVGNNMSGPDPNICVTNHVNMVK